MSDLFNRNLDKTAANSVPDTPVQFLQHTANTYPERLAVIHGDYRCDYATLAARCNRLASALQGRGIGRGDTVSIIAPNVPAHLEAHFGIPMCGAVLNSINVRLDADTIAYILDHGECDLLFVDAQFAQVAAEALALSQCNPAVVDIRDTLGPDGPHIGSIGYEELLAEGDPDNLVFDIDDDWQSLALNYTSGTTGRPKGVVYHHRGAYLNAIGDVLAWDMQRHPVYLWTLPMFHCNGWCFPWAITMQAGIHVCLRDVAAEPIISALAEYGVTHMCGAPIVLAMLVNAAPALREQIPAGLQVMTAGAAPPAAIIAAMEEMHYGPCVYCAWNDAWEEFSSEERAAMKARQGVPYPVLSHLDVLDPETMRAVPADGESMGEVMFRGNVVMKGYLKDPEATAEAFAGGWFHSGDLAVKHPNNYIEIRDRSKDIIISGGENISSIEVEGTLFKHEAVLLAAVVARPDEKWGETPCAFVELKEGAEVSEEELIEFCRDNMARFKAPRHVVFGELPKTSTGKIQKFRLREQAREI
jgi:fatty-acyl-CoA synthase